MFFARAIDPNKNLFSLLFYLSCLVFAGCAGTSQMLDAKKFYKHDMIMQINGEKFVGTAVPKLAKSYKIKVRTPGKISRMTFRSCHRDDDFKPDEGFFSSKKEYTYTYTPNEKEKRHGCLLDIGGYEARRFSENARHSWAVVALMSELENLPADIECNGESYHTTKSVAICQARTGSVQSIKFDHRLKTADKTQDPRCRVMQTKDEHYYEYVISEGECNYYFADKHGNVFRLFTFGYSTLLLRDADYEKDKK